MQLSKHILVRVQVQNVGYLFIFPCFHTVSIPRTQVQNVSYDAICLYTVSLAEKKTNF